MSTTGKTRGSYAKTPARRREILEAGIDVFSTSGFRSGSIREIAERVGMSQAGLLHHFSNKSELLAAVLQLRDDRSAEVVPIDDEHAGIDTVRGFVALMEYNATVPGLVELHCTLSAEATAAEHPAHQYFIDRYAYVVGQMRLAFERMRDARQLTDGLTPDGAARAVVALSDGLQVQWLLDRSSVDMAEEMRRYLRGILTVEL